MLENNVPIDAEYYLANMLAKPLLRIFEPIVGKEKAKHTLLRGDHARIKKVVTSNVTAYTQEKNTCLGCKVSSACALLVLIYVKYCLTCC